MKDEIVKNKKTGEFHSAALNEAWAKVKPILEVKKLGFDQVLKDIEILEEKLCGLNFTKDYRVGLHPPKDRYNGVMHSMQWDHKEKRLMYSLDGSINTPLAKFGAKFGAEIGDEIIIYAYSRLDYFLDFVVAEYSKGGEVEINN